MIKAHTWARVWMNDMLRKDRGASAVEYAILIAIIAVVVAGLAFAATRIIGDAENQLDTVTVS
jgi:Flp pilus assembly pilin Flp